MKETLVKAEYHVELTPDEHHGLIMRCDFQDGNDVVNRVLPDDVYDWTILDDEPLAIVVIKPNEYSHKYSLLRFYDALRTLLAVELEECVDEED